MKHGGPGRPTAAVGLALLVWQTTIGWMGVAAAGAGDGSIRWNAATERLEARVENRSIEEVLQQLAVATRWRIQYEPGITHRPQAEFTDAPLGEGLRRLLGPLNYLYLPGHPGRARLLVFNTTAAAATKNVDLTEIDSPGGPRRIEDELILRLDPAAGTDIEALARRLGGRVIGRVDELGAYRLQFDSGEAAQAARQQLAREGHRTVQDNYAIDWPGAGGSLSTFTLPAFSLRPSPADGSPQVIVAVVDTAIQRDGTILREFLLPEIVVAGPTGIPADQLSHGTSMASTILNSVALAGTGAEGTPVRILPVDVYGAHESTSSFAMAQGIHAAVSAGAQIVNLSLGGDGGHPLVHEVIRAGRARGVVFLGAAGNEPHTLPTFPAAYPEVVAVTAVDRRGEIAAYANRGDFVDVGAPGLSIVPFWDQPYYVVGTSTATAYVSGQAAALAATQGLNGVALENAIRQGASAGSPPASP